LAGLEAIMATLRKHGVSAKKVLLLSRPHSFWLFDAWLMPAVDAVTYFLGRVFCGSLEE
jgi:hypothetical protein